jgi:beta-lactam-binding protein with PASTA domain
MRICENCGRKNADDVDFCQCGEYLRWEPTNYQLPAIVPPAPDEPAKAPPSDPRAAEPATPAPPRPPETPEAHFVTAIRSADPRRKPPPSPPEQRGPTTPATPPPPPATAVYPSAAAARSPTADITLRLPEDEPSAQADALEVAVVPGDRVRVVAHVRNQGTIVDNYSLVVHGFPREWYTVVPETIYLVPFGSAGAYEQEVEIHLHPPRTPEAQARRWELSVGVSSRAHGAEVASAPMTLGIHPYEDYAVRVRPARASGRRRASYDVTIANNANAVALLALDANDSDGACEFTFEHDTVELGAGETKPVRLTCRPPRQIWIGRAVERRFEIACAGGEEGERLLQAKAAARQQGGGLAGLGGRMPRIPGVSAPKVNMPNVSIGAGGKLDVRMPNVRGPQFQGVNLRRPTLGLKALRMPDHAAAPALSSAPLLPTQAIFRQKAWLPWWLAIVVPLLLLLLLALFLLLPKNVKVPDVVGSKTVFGAERKLIAAGLQRGDTQTRPAAKVRPGTVLSQSPDAGASAKKGSAVSLEIAVGNGDTTVPKLAGLRLREADKALRAKHLQKGALSVQPPDPKLKIASTIPPAGERVKEGTPIDIFYPDPDAAVPSKQGPGKDGGPAPPGAAEVAVPEIEPTDQQGYAKVLSQAGLVPGPTERRIDDAPRGTVIGTDPPVGTKVVKNTKVTMIVSAGFPRIAYDDDRNVLLADGATGKRITPAVAKRPGIDEKDPSWSADGASIVYTAGGRLVSVDMIKRDRPPTALRPGTEKYGDPSFAPIATRSVLAVSRINGDGPTADRDLCVGRVKLDEYQPQCIVDDSFSIGFAHWSPDGRTILAFATSAKGFGIVQYTSKRAFSGRKADWGKGEFVTPRSGGKGVFDVALSPDGKRLAAIANVDSPTPQLYLTTPDDISLHKAKPLPIGACKVVWLDSRILALVKLGDCTQAIGEIVRVSVDDPTRTTQITAAGDNPTFQPLSAGG